MEAITATIRLAAGDRFERAGAARKLEPSPPDPCAGRDAILTGSWR